jgi:PiT family inorganic phosphate transporter
VTSVVVLVIITAIAFDFTNGFHDTANAMATSIATGALRPKVAVAISGVLNLVGAFLSVSVAKTISSGVVNQDLITPKIVFGGLIGALIWNVLTWYLSLPSSSSMALIGGLVGATLVAVGSKGVDVSVVFSKVLIPAFLAPVVAGIASLLATFIAYKITARTPKDSRLKTFKAGQIASASLVSLAHGTNDAQKTMGVITLVLIVSHHLPSGSNPPIWVISLCGLAIAAGTYIGGWRIIRTLGTRMTKIETEQGFAAESSSAATILISAHLGFALSTTQACAGSVIGTGLGARLAAVKWSLAGQMVIAWIVTIPAAALVGGVVALLADRGSWGIYVAAVIAAALLVLAFARSRKDKVTASNVNDDEISDRPAPRVPVGASA